MTTFAALTLTDWLNLLRYAVAAWLLCALFLAVFTLIVRKLDRRQ